MKNAAVVTDLLAFGLACALVGVVLGGVTTARAVNRAVSKALVGR